MYIYIYVIFFLSSPKQTPIYFVSVDFPILDFIWVGSDNTFTFVATSFT